MLYDSLQIYELTLEVVLLPQVRMSGRPPQTRVRTTVPKRTARVIKPKNSQLLGSWWPRQAALSRDTAPSPWRSPSATDSFSDVFKITLNLFDASLTLSFPGVILHLALNLIVKRKNTDSHKMCHKLRQSNNNYCCFIIKWSNTVLGSNTVLPETHTHVDSRPFGWAGSTSHQIQVCTEAKCSVWRVNTSGYRVTIKYPYLGNSSLPLLRPFVQL